jgi:ubiquinone/menaquinone biosynthesis C-methylase UbiE
VSPDPFQQLSRCLAERPDLWPDVREDVRRTFSELAPNWDSRLRPDHLAPLEAALDRVGQVIRALDLGTGTGAAARLVAERFPAATVVALDLTEEMIREAVGRRTARIRCLVGDGSALPFGESAFDLVTAVNVFVFWDEVTRVLAPMGSLAIEYSSAESTPIYVPVQDVERHLSRAGPYDFEEARVGRGIWLLARKRPG